MKIERKKNKQTVRWGFLDETAEKTTFFGRVCFAWIYYIPQCLSLKKMGKLQVSETAKSDLFLLGFLDQ